MRLVAIGGGELAGGGTMAIDNEIVEAADGDQALFVPAASGDSDEYIGSFRGIYGDKLGLTTDVLRLAEVRPGRERIHRAVSSADLVYVGGGNTKKMLQTWRQQGVDDALREHKEDTVLSGLSAGAVRWFESGHSDSERFESEGDDWSYTVLNGLGLVDGIVFCSHYDSEDRRDSLHRVVDERPGMVGVGVEDRAALDIRGDSYRAISSDPNANVYRVAASNSTVEEKTVPERDEFRPLYQIRSGSRQLD